MTAGEAITAEQERSDPREASLGVLLDEAWLEARRAGLTTLRCAELCTLVALRFSEDPPGREGSRWALTLATELERIHSLDVWRRPGAGSEL